MSVPVTGPVPVAGLRERKKQATKTALREAALRLALRHGVAGVTVEQIAEQADVSARTFFNYFASKEEAIVAADTAASGERLCRAFAERTDRESVTEALRAALLVVAAEGGRDRGWRNELRLVRATPSLLPHHIAAHLRTERELAALIGQRTGLDTAREIYPALLAASTVAALRVATRFWLDGNRPDDADGPGLPELVGAAFDLLGSGPGAPRAP